MTMPILNQTEDDSQPKMASPLRVIALFMMFFAFCQLLAGGAMLLYGRFFGMDFQTIQNHLAHNATGTPPNFQRGIILINHLFVFILPTLLTAWFVAKNKLFVLLKMNRPPMLEMVSWGFLWLLVSMPLVQFVYKINMIIPLPEWMHLMEDSNNALLKSVLNAKTPLQMIFTVFLVAVIPGIGEEMLFRGTVQQQFVRLIKNPQVAIWLSAAFFSAIHFQFEGFLARMLLGALLGYLFYWTNNLWIPAIIHFLNNGLQVVGMFAMKIKPDDLDNYKDIGISWWMALISLILCIAIGNYIKNLTHSLHRRT
jgi:membrane protease YdiL (CAAX protease family)